MSFDGHRMKYVGLSELDKREFIAWDKEFTWWTHPVGNKDAIVEPNHVIQFIIVE